MRTWYAVGCVTENELKVIQMRIEGMGHPEIARRLGISTNASQNRMVSIYRKIGLANVEELRQWAIANALDVVLAPEPAAPRVWKPGKRRIKMGRIRRARLGGL